MDNVLIDRSASGFDFRQYWTDGGDACRSLGIAMSLPTTTRSNHHSSFHYASPLPPPFIHQYMLQSSMSLPPLPPTPRRPPLSPLAPYRACKPGSASVSRTVIVEYKRKKQPRAGDEPPRVQRRKPLERAAPLPPAPAVDEALDDLEREVVRGFVEDLVHVLAPPPSSLPLPTFSLVKAAAAKAAAAALSCAAV